MAEPSWLARARSYLGLREFPGAKHNSIILRWWNGLFRDDETAWCGAFVQGTQTESGYAGIKNFAGARNWLAYGSALLAAKLGAIVVFSRPGSSWSGHVGYVVGKDKAGNLMVLGGNQGDMVSIKPFKIDRVLGYRWPPGAAAPANDNLPLLNSDGKVSVNEK